MNRTSNHIPELVVITGPPGVGKTTVARSLARFASRVGEGRAMVHIPVDELRAMVVLPGKEPDYVVERNVWMPMLEAQLGALRYQRDPEVGLVVVDGLFYDHADLCRLREIWPEPFFFHFHLTASFGVCSERNVRRKGTARLRRDELSRLYALPTPDDARVITLTGHETARDTAEQLLRQMILSGRYGP